MLLEDKNAITGTSSTYQRDIPQPSDPAYMTTRCRGKAA